MTDALSFEMAKTIIESSFTPIRCTCMLTEAGKVDIKLYGADGSVKLILPEFAKSRISSIRGVSQIVLETRQALAHSSLKRERLRGVK